MTIHEKKIVIDDAGTETFAFTFNGTVPGPLMVVHEGDYVELTLINPDTTLMMHNIDFHAATGALGGAALTHVNPGKRRYCASRPARPVCSSITALPRAWCPGTSPRG